MMPKHVQRPKILDISETQSSISQVNCYYLEMVEVKLLLLIDAPIALAFCGAIASRRVSFGIRLHTVY